MWLAARNGVRDVPSFPVRSTIAAPVQSVGGRACGVASADAPSFLRAATPSGRSPPKLLFHKRPTLAAVNGAAVYRGDVVMLAPIVTKDMKLFPTRPIPKHNIKNVRSRAQSLHDLGTTQRSQVVPIRQRSSVSVGHLPQPTAVAARSPPKVSSLRKPSTLNAIVEDVELSNDEPAAHTSHPSINPGSDLTASIPVTTSAPALNAKPKKGGIFKWISGALKSRSTSVEEMDDEDCDSVDKGTKRKASTGSGEDRAVRKSGQDQRASPTAAS